MPLKFLEYMRSVWELTWETLMEWVNDNAQVQGAALAFYTLFSLAPLLIILTVVVGYFLGQEVVQKDLTAHLSVYVGRDNARSIMDVIESTYKPGSSLLAAVIAVFLMLLGSSSVFLMLKSALNSIWGVTLQVEGYFYLVLDRLKSFLALLLIGLLLLISMVVKSFLAAFYQTISNYLVFPAILLQLLNQLFTVIFMSGLFAIVYKVLPDVKVPWRYAVRGALVTALLFCVGNIFLGLYLTRQSVASAYGAAGSLVVILMWVYYSALIIFLGAEFTQVYARRDGHTLEAKDSSFGGIKKLFFHK